MKTYEAVETGMDWKKLYEEQHSRTGITKMEFVSRFLQSSFLFLNELKKKPLAERDEGWIEQVIGRSLYLCRDFGFKADGIEVNGDYHIIVSNSSKRNKKAIKLLSKINT
jgi:hypothetical protein